MKNFHWMLIAVASLGIFATSGIADHVMRGSMEVPLPGVQGNGQLYCFDGEGIARYRFNTRTYRGVLRARGDAYNGSGRTQRYNTNALVDSCIGDIIYSALHYHGFGSCGEDLEDVQYRAFYRVGRRGNAFGLAAVKLPEGFFDVREK